MGSEGVPVIDMQRVEGVGKEIVKACEEWGCFRMVNHGVPAELLSEMKAVMSSLFDLPEETKRGLIHPADKGKGYMERNHASPYLEGFSIDEVSTTTNEFCDRLGASPHQREVIYKYIKAIRDLAGLVGRKLMEGVGLSGDLLDGWCCQLRMNKYHYCPESVGSSGIGVHSDPNFLTILQDDENVNGLQLVDKDSGEFTPVDHIPGTLVANLGDLAKAWSNGRFYNVKHRVQCVEPKTRYSIVLFMLGPKDKKVEAPAVFVDSEHPRLYHPIDYTEYRHVRTAKKCGTGGALDLFKMEA